MPAGIRLSEWRDILDRTKFAQVDVAGNSASNLFSSDVPEDRVRYITALIASTSIGSVQRANVSKVEEDDTTSVVLSGLVLPGDDNVAFSTEDNGVFFPRLEGGTNVEFNPGTSGASLTAFFFDNET